MRLEYSETKILREVEDVGRFLSEMNLFGDGILAIRDAAYSHRVDASPLMALNAPGSLAYHYGVLELRQQFLGAHWEIDRIAGVEGISHTERKIKIAFQNVDVACSLVADPKPCSEKGAGAERECEGNLFEAFGVPAPKMIRTKSGMKASYFVMVDDRGAVELSRPVIENGKYAGFVDRVFISDGSDIRGSEFGLGGDAPPPIDDFDVSIVRR
ncbi:hypothetical protein GOB42_15240 [Sinorhizobium meliloti]|nr:hypothetical protein [Sinorhizobium meliloti]